MANIVIEFSPSLSVCAANLEFRIKKLHGMNRAYAFFYTLKSEIVVLGGNGH